MQKNFWKLLALGVLAFQLSSQTLVQAAHASDDDDYNFSWLDPDKKIYVLQNRKYRKANHAMISVMGGTTLGETYRTVYQVQPRLGYWFDEEFGIEAFYSDRFNSPNNAYRGMINALGSGSTAQSPVIREITSQVGLLLNWAPWYAKINVFNSILYFDWYFSLGAGSMTSQVGLKTKDDPVQGPLWQTENLFAVFLGTGHLFHLSDATFARLDFLSYFYSADVNGGYTGGGSTTIRPVDQSIYSNFTVSLGFGFKL
jgi:outer membrane beta-barrel protein